DLLYGDSVTQPVVKGLIHRAHASLCNRSGDYITILQQETWSKHNVVIPQSVLAGRANACRVSHGHAGARMTSIIADPGCDTECSILSAPDSRSCLPLP